MIVNYKGKFIAVMLTAFILASSALMYSVTDIYAANVSAPSADNQSHTGAAGDTINITKTGRYQIELWGAGGGSYVEGGSYIAAHFELISGNVLTSVLVPGGAATGLHGAGNDGIKISSGATLLMVAGGGGGSYAPYRDYTGNGGAGGYVGGVKSGMSKSGMTTMYWGNDGTSVNKNATDSFAYGAPGYAYGQCSIGGYGGYWPWAGTQGSSYINMNLAKYVKDYGFIGSTVGYKITKLPDNFSSDLNELESNIGMPPSFNSIRKITSLNDYVSVSANAEFIADLPIAEYKITINGGSSGGQVYGNLMLQQGESIKFRFTEDSNLMDYTAGGNAVSALKNGTLIAGTGGGSVIGTETADTYKNVAQIGGGIINYYSKGVYKQSVGDSSIYSDIFGTGGYNYSKILVSDIDFKGTDVQKLVERHNGAPRGMGGANMIDISYWLNYQSVPGAGTGGKGGNATIQLIRVGTSQELDILNIKDLLTSNASITADVQRSLINDLPASVITVLSGKNFSIDLPNYQLMGSGSFGGVSVENGDITDGKITINGRFDAPGRKTIVIDGKIFLFNVVKEPDSANVKVVFN